jgi:hypothetical protein
LPAGDEIRHDVLIQEMVNGQVKGTAVADSNHLTDNIISNGQTVELLRSGLWQRPQLDIPDHLSRLQKLLGGVRRTFGKGIWQVDWGDDGRICWLLQIRNLEAKI